MRGELASRQCDRPTDLPDLMRLRDGFETIQVLHASHGSQYGTLAFGEFQREAHCMGNHQNVGK